jgi:archaellum component FlaF (FlaF/FlaG flagellin family)
MHLPHNCCCSTAVVVIVSVYTTVHVVAVFQSSHSIYGQVLEQQRRTKHQQSSARKKIQCTHVLYTVCTENQNSTYCDFCSTRLSLSEYVLNDCFVVFERKRKSFATAIFPKQA